jgi:hypothetical protein
LRILLLLDAWETAQSVPLDPDPLRV